MSFQKKTAAIADQLAEIKIIPVLAIEKVADGLKICEILSKCGLPAAEITFRTAAAEEIIAEASKQFPEMLIGAGTILNPQDLDRAFNAGSSFAVAPGFNPTVLREAIKNEQAFMPGITTPSEVEQALELGLRAFKFFPAEACGGIPMLQSVIAPYKHLGVRFMPTGGINTKNVGDYLAIPEVVACGGTWLGKAKDIESGNWAKIEELIIEAVKITSK